MAKVGRQLRVYGRVQGVFFRQWTLNQARRLGVSGWVRNRPDGTVEAHLTGEEDAVAKLVAAMHQGPSQAVVEHIVASEVEPEEASDFSVRS